jgi:hypothetical protein
MTKRRDRKPRQDVAVPKTRREGVVEEVVEEEDVVVEEEDVIHQRGG